MRFYLTRFLTACILCCELALPARAQNTSPMSTYLNNFVQPPPNAAALGKYADFPVGYYTGVPNISVPLYNLQDGGINLPISISYHASGIRVSEIASWVGLGWALNATGVINRTVRGAPDEGTRKSGGAPYAPRGYYEDYGWFGAQYPQFMPYPGPDNGFTDQHGVLAAQGAFYNSAVNGALNGGSDFEPDLYTFNFAGHTGKFVFDEKRNVRLLEDDNLKIKSNYNSTSHYFDSWIITDENGIRYYFGENGAHEIVVPVGHGSWDANSMLPANWYLTRIVNPNTKDSVIFNYAPEGYTYYDLGPESTIYGQGGPILTSACDNSTINNNGASVDNFLTTNVVGLRLSSIVTNNFTVRFIAQTPRQDISQTYTLYNTANGFYAPGVWNGVPLGGAAPAYTLDTIKVYSNQNNTCLKQIVFAHSYFQSPKTTGPAVVMTLKYINDTTDTRRLKLVSVKEISGDGSLSRPPYTFNYQESIVLPRRLSYDQDHWGFSNSQTGDNNNYFTPGVAILNLSGKGANRKAKWPEMSAFTLTAIHDPLGVSTAFTYGQNSAQNGVDQYGITDTLISGLRIQQIAVTDNVTGVTQYRKFSYNQINSTLPSGIMTHMPVYIMVPYNKYFSFCSVHYTSGPPVLNNGGYAGSYYDSYTPSVVFKQSQGIVPMQDANGNQIVYPYVRETFSANGEGGYKQYSFNVSYGNPNSPQVNSRLDYTNYVTGALMPMQSLVGGSQGSIITAWGDYGRGDLNDTTANPQFTAINLKYSDDFYENYNAYPSVPTQVDLIGSKLLEEDTYDATGHLVSTVTNQYATNYHENFWIRGLRACFALNPSIFPYNGLSFYKLHTGISHLVSTTKKTFNGNSYVTEVSHYGYDSPYHTLKTSDTTTSSQGDTLINRTYYSFDYVNSATADNIFGKMKTRNILSPISSSTWKNGKLIEGKITQYQDFALSGTDTLINPGGIYALETVSPLTATLANETIGWNGQLTSLLPNTYFKSKATFGYDSYNGRLINQQLTSNINNAVVWDTHFAKPIAIGTNTYNQAHSVVSYANGTSSVNITLPASGGSTHYQIPFTVTGSGSSALTLSFSGNPNAPSNPQAVVNCTISGLTSTFQSYNSSILQLSICAGSCSGGVTSGTIAGLVPGSYVLTVYYAAPPTLFCNVSVQASYPTVTSSISTAGPQQFFYQGFEQSAVTNVSPGVFTAGTAHTGTNFWAGSYTVNFTPPADGRTYKITYWYLSGGVWNFSPEQNYTGSSFALSGGTAYDDVRVFPSDAQMTTYTYDASGNITSSSDAKSLTTFYEYDGLQRLINIRDKDKNIVKHIDYHYQGQ